MATPNIRRAASTVASPRFIRTVGLVAVGSVAAAVVADFGRSELVEIDIPGADLPYAALGAIATIAVFPPSWAVPLAAGMGATGVQSLLNDMEVL
jgi:hypothetical protein